MKPLTVLTVLMLIALPVARAFAEPDKPVNAMCPIGKEPIVPSAGTVESNGHTIGLCCPSCGKAFLAWDETRRDAFVTLAMRGAEPGQPTPDPATQPAATSRPATGTPVPYLLDVCIVSGGKLGSMGDPVIKQYDGREVRFCCAGCIGRFEADKAGFFEKMDKLIVADQLRYYPTDTCIVTGEPLVEDGKDIATNLVWENRLVRLCCTGCGRKLKADPAKSMDKLDALVMEAQRAAYPMTTCVVAGGPLGSMGEPAEMVVAGRLLRLCCGGCKPKVEADPAKYLAMIDRAWQAQGEFLTAAE